MADSVRAAKGAAKAGKQPIGLLAALHHIYHAHKPVLTDQFFDEWATMTPNDLRKSVPFVLQRALWEREAKLKGAGGRIHDRDRMLMIVLALNAEMKGESINGKTLGAVNNATTPMPKLPI